MPRSPQRTTRRRNPDAYEDEQPKTLRDYFEDVLEEARQDLEVTLPSVNYVEFHEENERGLNALGLNVVPFGGGNVYFLFASLGRRTPPTTARKTARALARVADKMGLPMTTTTHSAKVSLPSPWHYLAPPIGATYVYLPSTIPPRIGKQLYENIDKRRSIYGLSYSQEPLATYHLPRVPEVYREQIGRLVRQAFENDDLATYLQARELAALVSE
jgi:hypothetical protein